MSVNNSEFNINKSDPYYITVKTVFDNWTALQLAVTHNFGGSDTKEAAEWFLNATYQWIVENNDLEDIDLEDYLCDTMNNEFNTIIDDGSCLEIGRVLLNFNNLYKNGKLIELEQELIKKYSKGSAKSLQQSLKCTNNENPDTSDEEESNDEAMEEENDTKPKNVMTAEENENFEQLEEGWTFVTKTGKHVTK